MSNHEDPNKQEPDKALLLDKINAVLADLGSDAKYLKLPKDCPEYKSLKGKKILMLDDIDRLLEAFLPDLIVATDGNAAYIFHKGASPEDTAKEILEQNPDIALLDYSLQEGVKGTDVYKKLQEKGFAGLSIGFSSDKDSLKNFQRVGADGIEKDTFDTGAVVKEIAKLVKEKTL